MKSVFVLYHFTSGWLVTMCWHAIGKRDARKTGEAMSRSFEGQIALFHNMVDQNIWGQIEAYKNRVPGWKMSGAGNSGYPIFFSETSLENAIHIRIRR